jgi:aldehyde:ferredoxin oxidoreductase
MTNVYTRQVLRVDLGSGTIESDEIPEETIRRWFLGSGLAAYLFYQQLDPQMDPLDPASPLMAFTGLLTGTFAPAASRSSWCGRSPLTGIWGESNVGGHWGAELRFAGFDGVVVTGRAAEPVYLWIEDNHAEIRDASDLWGRGTYEVQKNPERAARE